MELDLNELEKQEGQSPFVAKFQAFFETQYMKQLERLAVEWPQKKSLIVDYHDLEHYDFELADELLETPDVLSEAAEMSIQNIHLPVLETHDFKPHVRFYNLPKDRSPLLRNIGAQHLNKLISVEGVVRQLTDVLPKLEIAAWQCRRCGNVYKREQESDKMASPAMCECRHRDFQLLANESTFIDNQKVQIQEPLELLKGSEQATVLDIIVSDDLVNKVMPGDRTRLTGIIRLRSPKEKNLVFGRFLDATHLEETAKEFDEVEISPEEKKQIEELARNPKIYELLAKSIATNIYGHETVKEAISLQLFGGVKKILPNETTIRGNIHVLLVGDPGVAKSAILQAVHKIAPKSIYTAGKTSTGVGLCVAPDSLILNDGGFKPIQEFVEDHFDETIAKEELSDAFSTPFDGKAFALTKELQFSSAPIEKVWRIKAPEKMIRIKTRMGKELSLTPITSLIRIKRGIIEWIAAKELQEGDFVATPRILPEGNKTPLYSFLSLLKEKTIKAAIPADWFKEITNRLLSKYGSLQAIAQKTGKNRNTLYSNRNQKFSHAWELFKIVELAQEAGYKDAEIAGKIEKLFIRHGKEIQIPLTLNNSSLAYLAGLALGDGNLIENKNSASLRIFSEDPSILVHAEQIIQALFGIPSEYFDDGKRVPGVRIKYKVVIQLLKEFGLRKNKKQNHLSHRATEMPNPILASLLRGLFDTDGYVSQSEDGSVNVGIGSISKSLAQGIHLSLLKFGIQSKMRFRAKAGKIAVGKKITVIRRSDQWYIEIRGKENLEQFQAKIGFELERKKEALKQIIAGISKANTNLDVIPEIVSELQNTNAEWVYKKGKRSVSRQKLQQLTKELAEDHLLKQLGKANIFWDQIKTKEEFAPHYPHVYDFTVQKHHNFIANGFFVHNTASAVKDDFGEGGWTLKAGALVLANGGLAMIDEFDKMECLTGDALVCIENGELKTMEELFEAAKSKGRLEKTEKGTSIREIQNQFVLSMDQNLKISKKRLLAVHQYPHEGRILKVTLQSGETLQVTPNHPFFTSNENGVHTVKAGRLQEKDFVVVPSELPTESQGKPDEKRSRLYGYLAGDGNVTYNPAENYFLRFTNKEPALLEDFANCGDAIFERPSIYPSDIREDGVTSARINGQRFVDHIAQQAPGLLEKYSNKFSPKSIYQTSSDTRNYLRSIFDSEGSVNIQHRQISFSSTSPRLTTEVKTLLLKEGILTQSRVQPATKNRRKAFILRITDYESLQRYAKQIGFLSPKKQAKTNKIIEKETSNRSILNVIPYCGKLLKEIRTGLGLKQKECGLHIATYNNFEKETANISIPKAQKVLKIFKSKAQTATDPTVHVKLQLLDTFVNGNIRWRKIKSIQETTPSTEHKISFAQIHSVNQSLKTLQLPAIIPKNAAEQFLQKKASLEKKQIDLEHDIQTLQKCDSVSTLAAITQKHKISNKTIATKMKVNQSTINRWLRNRVNMPVNAIEKVKQTIVENLLDQQKLIGKIIPFLQIKNDSKTYIYDLTVEDSHNFIANNIIVHNSEDRSAMHEAMEQGMISVAKAGIVTRFKTDTTILAAANPKFARFDQYKNFLEQIDLPPTLISRFDLFFMIFDILDRKKDEDIAQHILKTHQAGESMLQHRLKSGKKRIEAEELEQKLAPPIEAAILKKYIAYARQNIFPILTKEAIQTISDYYVDLREQGKKQGTYSATHRQLEGLVRLSEASARIRLSSTIEKEDTDRAIHLLKISLQELVTDKETGKLDIDLLTTGQSTSQTNQLKTILGIVQSLNQEHDKVLMEQVIDEAQKQGIEKDKTRELVSKLKRTGDLYEPSHGIIKPVHKEY